MTGKEGKGSRSSTQTSGGNGGGGGSVTETGALFPRLHVKETKRVGPRAPPRNKMALYEQFTFPSHRYVPPSMPLPAAKTPQPTYTPQRPSYEGSMFYGPVPAFGVMPGMPNMPWMPYSEMYTGSYFGGQPSVNGSSSSTIVDCETQGTVVPASDDAGRSVSNAAGDRNPWVSSHSNVDSVSSKKARNNNDRTVPTYNPPGPNGHGPPTLVAGSDQRDARAGHHHKDDSASTRQPRSVSSDRHVESSRNPAGIHSSSGAGKGEGRNAEKSRKAGNNDQEEEDQSELPESTGVVENEMDSVASRRSNIKRLDSHYSNAKYGKTQYQQKKGLQADASSDVCLKRANFREESSTGTEEDRGDTARTDHGGSTSRHAQTREPGHTNSTARDTAKKDKAGSTPRHALATESSLSNTTARDTSPEENRGGHDRGEQVSKKRIHDCKSSSSAESGDELEVSSPAEVSDASQPEGDQSERADSDAGDAPWAETELGKTIFKVAPKDIVTAIGEQEFWRVRKLILRQQKIFSSQLFELHRIIKVQQLLASSPLTIDRMVASAGEKPAETAEPGQADQAKETEKFPQNIEAFEVDKGSPEDPTGKHTDSSGQSSTSDRVCDQPPVVDSQPRSQSESEQVPTTVNAPPGACSTASWRGQPYGKAGSSSSWFGAVPAPNGAYMYPPYHGSFNSPQVNNMAGYNGAYHPVMCTPGAMDMPSMTPYVIPRYEQQPNLMQDMYGYASYQQPQWPGPPMCFPSNPGGNWCGMQSVPMMGMNPTMRGPYGWYNDMAAGPHPSNYVRPSHQSSVQPIPSAFHPSSFVMHSPWADTPNSQHQQAGGEAGNSFQPNGVQRPLPSENGKTATDPVFQKPRSYTSDQDYAPYGSYKEQVGGVPFGEASAVTFQKPVHDTSSQDCEVSVSQHRESGEGNGGWRRYDGHNPRHSVGDPAEGSSADKHSNVDKQENIHKRSRGSRQEVDGSGDKNGTRNSVDNLRQPADSQMDALPLFPMGPASKGGEDGRHGYHCSSGVIKAVPRALVATAESTAEILLSIQSQRQ